MLCGRRAHDSPRSSSDPTTSGQSASRLAAGCYRKKYVCIIQLFTGYVREAHTISTRHFNRMCEPLSRTTHPAHTSVQISTHSLECLCCLATSTKSVRTFEYRHCEMGWILNRRYHSHSLHQHFPRCIHEASLRKLRLLQKRPTSSLCPRECDQD